MWSYDINKENWSPISFKSSVVPSPRSELAHTRYQDDFIIFGGKGDTELFNDIYRYSTRDHAWKLIEVDTTPKPAARRAACMAAADDFILLYGGVQASGYSDELWKFEWATQSYTLLESSSSNPKSAFSQCHIETN
jgi:N-acetylneuraminic acid mutarotase